MQLLSILLTLAIAAIAAARPGNSGAATSITSYPNSSAAATTSSSPSSITSNSNSSAAATTTPSSPSSITSSVSVSSNATATATGTAGSAFTPTPLSPCLASGQASAIVSAFIYLLANPTATNFVATADALFADDFTDTSDSINQLAGIPEGSVTFSSKADFIAGSGSQPPLYLSTLQIFNDCAVVGWRWISTSGTGDDSEAVKGIDVFEINAAGQIEAVYAEFNSGAWLADLDYPECSPTATATIDTVNTATAAPSAAQTTVAV